MNDLATKQPALAAQWHPTKNGDFTPQQVASGGGRSQAWWQCEKGREWKARVAGRITGRGCPECWAGSYASKAETELFDFITYLLPGEVVVQGDRKTLKGKEIDVYVPSLKLGVEFNGLFWHTEEAGRGRRYHEEKYLAAKAAGVQLIQVWEDDYNRHPDLVKRILSHKLGVSDQPAVYARKTRVEVLTTSVARVFLDQNHIQGFASGSYYLGLRDIETNGLVAVMVLKREVGVNVPDRTLNISRYATSTRVPGGFTKLLKHAERTYNPSRFITFADHCISDGALYEGNGFVADKVLPP
ncbi:MAG: zinc-ribbon domain-containing protein, partial [Pseudomonadota bacterium]|nr:zinc-ribbon domain-containing protein [Pseudomonadota bacterium]